MSYQYLLYGLKIESEFEIAEAYRRDFDDKPDVRIVLGQMPEQIQKMYADKNTDERFFATSRNSVAFRIPGVADYWVTKDKITVNPLGKIIDYIEVDSYLLGVALAFCLALRDELLLHGGAVAKDGKGVIITGNSGCGKSTISEVLLSKGYMFVADDTCAITNRGGKAHICMGYPQQKLCRDAAISSGYDLSELIFIDEDRDKYARRLKEGFLPDGIDFKFLFELVLSEDEDLHFTRVEGHDKLKLILRNLYAADEAFKIWGCSPDYMHECVKTASNIIAYQIVRPKGKDTIQKIAKYVDSIVNE